MAGINGVVGGGISDAGENNIDGVLYEIEIERGYQKISRKKTIPDDDYNNYDVGIKNGIKHGIIRKLHQLLMYLIILKNQLLIHYHQI